MDYVVFVLLGALCMALLEEFNINMRDDFPLLAVAAVTVLALVWL